MRQVLPGCSIFFDERPSLEVSESQPGIPSNMTVILAIFRCKANRTSFPCFSHCAPVPFSEYARAPRLIGFCTGGRSHKLTPCRCDLEHKKPLKSFTASVPALPGILARNESTTLQRIEGGSSSFVDQLAEIQFRVER